MPAPESSALARRAGFLLLAFAVVVSSWGYWYHRDRYPAWLDFDSATLGIFVNNVTYHGEYDHLFRTSPIDQDQYRARWAAHFLPAATVLGFVQRALSIPPDQVGDLLDVAALLFGAFGVGCVAWLLWRRDGRGEEALFVAGLTSTLPPFLLYVRTTQPHFLFSFLMFWIAMLAIDRYFEARSAWALVVLAVTMALYAQAPYVPIVVLPVAAVLLASMRGRVVESVRDVRLYLAAAGSAMLAAVVQIGVATAWEPSWQAWWAKAGHFVASRSRVAWPGGVLDPGMFHERAVKLLHQHFWFRWDHLGDRTRNDHLWTLPQPHVVWLALVPVAVLGAWHAWRTRDRTAAVFAAVLLATYGIALTVGMTEGRYMLPAVPALAYFAMSGLRALAGTRSILLAFVLLACAANSWVLVRGEYSEAALRRWRAMAGMRETLALIRREFGEEYGRSRDVELSWPGLRYEAALYAQMLGNSRIHPFGPDENLAALAPGEPLFAVVEAGTPTESEELQRWRMRGFREAGRVEDGPTGREFIVLVLPY